MLFRSMGSSFSLRQIQNEQIGIINPDVQLIIDSGFSNTHIIPYFSGFPLNYATKRINVGGKILTNYLKREITLRSFHLMNESLMVSQIKECSSHVSLNLIEELDEFKYHKQIETTSNAFKRISFT